MAALGKALDTGKPVIFNTDQGCQFTSSVWINKLKAEDILISMDGRGRALDNIFVERLWRSVKYEEIYPNAHRTMAEAEKGLNRYFEYYNHSRPHQALGYRTPWQVHQEVITTQTEVMTVSRTNRNQELMKKADSLS